jgi:histidinol phosphatase-like enzyme
MKIPSEIICTIRECAYHASKAKQKEQMIMNWLEEHGCDIEKSIIASDFIDWVLLSDNAESFIDELKRYGVGKG